MKQELIRAQKLTLFTLVGVLGLAIVKIIFGLYFGSMAILADGVHSFGDVLIILLVLVALKFMSKKPSERFPYGYYKVEDFVVLVLSLVFFFVALEIIIDSMFAIVSLERKSISVLAASIGFASGVVSFVLARVQERVARETNTSSVLLNAKEMKIDSLSSTIVGLALLLESHVALPLDSIAALIIAVFILKIAIEGLKNSVLSLLDAWDKPKLINEIKQILEEIPEVKDVYSIRLRKAGPLILGDSKIAIPEDVTASEIRELEERISSRLRSLGISDFVIHVVPIKKEKYVLGVPVETDKVTISNHFGRAPLICIASVNLKTKTYQIIKYVKNPFLDEKDKIGIRLAKLVSEEKIDTVLVRNIGENAYYLLKGHKIEVLLTKENELEKAIRAFIEGKASKLNKPTKQAEMMELR